MIWNNDYFGFFNVHCRRCIFIHLFLIFLSYKERIINLKNNNRLLEKLGRGYKIDSYTSLCWIALHFFCNIMTFGNQKTQNRISKRLQYVRQLYIISHFWLDWIDQKAFERNYYVICI